MTMVKKDHDVEGKISHHLIIDKESVGEKMWTTLIDDLRKHVSN